MGIRKLGNRLGWLLASSRLTRHAYLRMAGRRWQAAHTGKVSRWRRVLRRRSVRLAAGGMAALIVATLFFTVFQQKQAAAATWWSPSWKYRKQITFNNSASSEDLTNFPVRVALSSGNIDYSKTMDNGHDIRFTDSDGTTPLNYEIENWDEAGTSNIWVKVPQIDDTSTTDSIWMYYGNPSANDAQNKEAVWSSDFAGVWHLNNNPALGSESLTDSSAFDNDLSTGGSMTSSQQVTGKIGTAVDFDGTNDFASTQDMYKLNGTDDMTVSFWLKLDTTPTTKGANMNFVRKGHSASPSNSFSVVGNNSDSNKLLGTWTSSASTIYNTGSTSALTTGGWTCITYFKSGTSAGFYINGSLNRAYTDTHATTIFQSNSPFFLAGDTNNTNNADGQFDELRLSTVARSADWAEAEWITQNDAMNSFGSEQSGTYAPGGSWSRRRKITLNNSASTENLTGFPLRVSLTSSNIDYGQTQNNGQDIRFTDSDGSTQLNYEIEKWDEGGTSEVWVEVPQIDAASTTDHIWMYYGNTSAVDEQNPRPIWDYETYPTIYHMSETSGHHQDSSISDLDSTTTTPTAQGTATGKIAGADDFESTGSPVVSRTDESGLSSVTAVEAWVSMESTSSSPRTIVSKDIGSNHAEYELQVTDTDEITWRYWTTGGAWHSLSTTTSPLANTGQFYKINARISLISFATSTYGLYIYVNGAIVASTTTSSTGGDAGTGGPLYIGTDTSNQRFDGIIDEVRLYNSHPSAEWMEASYISENLGMATFGSEESGTFFGGPFTYRRKITFNNAGSGALTNFPVRVSLSAAKGNVNYANIVDAGQDIRFVDADDSTALPYEIEKWDETGTSEVWVKVPQIDSGSATDYIWMYYSNSSAADGQQPASVWDSNNRGVWHMNESTGTTVADSTSSDIDLFKDSATNPAPAGGIIAGAQAVDATDDGLDFGDAPLIDNQSEVLVSAWVNVADSASTKMIASIGTISSQALVNLIITATEVVTCESRPLGAETIRSTATTAALTTGTWHNVTCAINFATDTVNIYFDGKLVQTGNPAYTATSTDGTNVNMRFGLTLGSLAPLNGTLDEVRVTNSVRSADWINAEYRTGADQFNTFGAEESQSSAAAAWCNDATGVTCNTYWQYRRRVELINMPSAENLSGFPVLIKLSAALGNIDYSKTQANGEDLRFVDPSDNTTAIPHEIETWNESGESFVWVKVPQIDTGKNSDYIYMYYGNASIASPATQLGSDTHETGVWDANYGLVYHLDETSGAHQDSTANNLDTTTTSPTVQGTATGKIGGADDFEASNANAMLYRTDNNALDGQDFTIEAWVTPESAAVANMPIIYKNSNYDMQFRTTDEVYLKFVDQTVTTRSVETTTSPITPGSTYKITGVRNDTDNTLTIYINGTFVTSATLTQNVVANANDFSVGRNGTGTEYFDGVIDEVRMSNTFRTADWIEANYNSEMNTMVTYGIQEEAPLPPPTLTAFTAQTPTTPTFEVRGYDPFSASYLRYKIEVCSDSDCSTVIRTIDQTASQTGWTGQDAQTNTAYVAGSTIGGSTLANHTYQGPALSNGTNYWWRAYAIDPAGKNEWSDPTAISSFQTLDPPATPTLVHPANGATGVSKNPDFRLWTIDSNSDNVKYQIEVCDTASCTDTDGGGPLQGVFRTIDQRSSQTGWAAQNAESGTAYSTHNSTLASSQQAIHTYQMPELSPSVQYWWRATAYDPTGSNMSSSTSSIWSFTTNGNPSYNITGGTTIEGGTNVGQ